MLTRRPRGGDGRRLGWGGRWFNSPLFSCALAEMVPSVKHHAAAEGEECGGLEASCGQVALRWAVQVSKVVLSYICF